MVRKRHKVNYLNGFDKKRVVSQYAAKYVTLLSVSPQNNGLQISVGHFLYNFMHRLAGSVVDKQKIAYFCKSKE